MTALADEVRGVLFGSTLIAETGDKSWDLLWEACDQQLDDRALIECEVRAFIRPPTAPTCFVGELAAAPPTRMFLRQGNTRLVVRIASEAPFVGRYGQRNCRLDNEQRYRGTYSWEFEHSGFYPTPGQRWWWELSTPVEFAVEPLRVGNLNVLCVETLGVALPEPEFGAGHMGQYNREFFVTELISATAPTHSDLTARLSFVEDQYAICAVRSSLPASSLD